MDINLLCDHYLRYYADKKTAKGDEWMINKYVRPALGERKVARVQYHTVWSFHQSMKHTPYQANRVLSLLGVMFTLARRLGVDMPKGNPAQLVKRFKEKARHRFLTDEEIKRLISVLEAHFEEKPLESALFLLLLYTGARCGEITKAKWKDILPSGTEIFLTDSKTGSRIVYLTPQAVHVLSRLGRVRDWIIGPDIHLRWYWKKALKEAGLSDLRIHDLRHCFASVGVSAEQSLGRIGGLLGHRNPTMTAIYAHLVPSAGRASALAIGKQFENITK